MKARAVLLGLLVSGCASHHDLAGGGTNLLGGGVRKSEIKPGLFEVFSRTNWAPWPNYISARSAWKDVASDACGKNNYEELATREQDRDTGMPKMGILGYIVTEKEGYALCKGAAISREDVDSAIAERERYRSIQK